MEDGGREDGGGPLTACGLAAPSSTARRSMSGRASVLDEPMRGRVYLHAQVLGKSTLGRGDNLHALSCVCVRACVRMCCLPVCVCACLPVSVSLCLCGYVSRSGYASAMLSSDPPRLPSRARAPMSSRDLRASPPSAAVPCSPALYSPHASSTRVRSRSISRPSHRRHPHPPCRPRKL